MTPLLYHARIRDEQEGWWTRFQEAIAESMARAELRPAGPPTMFGQPYVRPPRRSS